MVKTLFLFLRRREAGFSFVGAILSTVVGLRRQGFRAWGALNRLRGKTLTAEPNHQVVKSPPTKEKQENNMLLGFLFGKETTC
jgi:hypothetical protein